jgi:hypothetical protein
MRTFIPALLNRMPRLAVRVVLPTPPLAETTERIICLLSIRGREFKKGWV